MAAVAAIPVIGFARDVPLELEDAVLQHPCFARRDAVARRAEDSPLECAGLAVEAACLAYRENAAHRHRANVRADPLDPARHRTGETDAIEAVAVIVRVV